MDEAKVANSRKWWVIAVVALVIIIGIYFGSSKTPAGGYNIGAVISLTGNNAAYGQSAQRGMQLAMDEINKDGSKLNVLFEDDRSTNDGAVSAFQKLISTQSIPVAVGFVGSGGAVSASAVAEASKVVEISTSAGTDEMKEAGDYVFRIREKSSTHGQEMARYVKNKLGLNKVALYYANASNGISYADAFKEEFVKIGGTIVADEKYVEKSNDHRSQLSKLKLVGPEGVYLAGTAIDMAQIMLQAESVGLKTRWFVSAGAENPKIIEIAKDKAEGLVYTTPAFDPEDKSGLVANFVEAYQKKYAELPNFAAANGYDGIVLAYQVIKKYGYGVEDIKRGLYLTQNFPGVGGQFSFDKFGEVEKQIMFKTVKGGKFVRVGEQHLY
jgi:branched-chain amino acid transport system substrate-binding protein